MKLTSRMLPLTLVFILSFTLLANGCQNAGNPGTDASSPSGMPGQTGWQRNQQTAPSPAKDQDAQTTAQRLADLAVQTPNVNDATAIVVGKVAVVGIDVDAKLDRSRVGTIKYTVAQALRKDPQGAQAMVTSDPDIVQRLREIRNSMDQGEPADGFAEELSEIVARLMPQFPRQVENRVEPPRGGQDSDGGKNTVDQSPNNADLRLQ